MDVDDKKGDSERFSTHDVGIHAHNKVSFDVLKTLSSCKNVAQIPCIVLDCANNLDFGKRDEGSTSSDWKHESLQKRWFSKTKVNVNKSDMDKDKSGNAFCAKKIIDKINVQKRKG